MVVCSSQKVFQLVRPKLRMDVEEFWILGLTQTKKILGLDMLFRGTVDHCLVHQRDIYRFLIGLNASGFIAIHNHPCGSCYPSHEDIQLTQKFLSTSKLMGIDLIDHIIVTHEDYYSFVDSGLFEKPTA